ncbi:MAG: trypsin-like serine protease [Armatimonadetes bacterium]|nr:trypsin-like serine protease [Armatimonadota bacterium]
MKLLTCAAAMLAAISTAYGIVIRHDRPDSRYLELAKGHDEAVDIAGAMGTLIDKRWVLTAGHVGLELSPYTSFVRIKGRVYQADRVIIHPDFVKDGLPSGRDFTLMHLTEDVKGITPVGLYTGKDEQGQRILVVGRGDTGTGLTGPTGNDGKMRGAENKVDDASETSISFAFDEPGKALDLEGISGPGDSGGPALIQKNGRWWIVGVSSANRGPKTCQYGSVEVYARVSTAIDWIRSVMNGAATASSDWVKHTPFSGWQQDRVGEICAALVNSYNSPTVDAYEAFNQRYRDKEILGRRTPEQRATAWTNYREQYGDLEVLEYATRGDQVVSILTRSKKTHEKAVISVFLQGQGADAVFEGWNIDPI